ncbi:MAG: ATP-binding protein [Myxococcales bacterium]|nr:ATP-binding protein [Myxococcales bacterium]MCA9639302.1 ATP-binding protein [Myxococcales bacterium]
MLGGDDARARALGALDIGRLRDVARGIGAVPDDRRSRSSIVDAIVRSMRAAPDFRGVLERLGRDELKSMCRAVGAADDGREKAVLVERLLAAPTESSPSLDAAAFGVPGEVDGRWRVLTLLKRSELQEAAERAGVRVADRRVTGQLAAALLEASVPTLTVLEPLPRARLKELCRTLGLDETARDKASLIARLADYAGDDLSEYDAEDEEELPPAAASDPHIEGDERVGIQQLAELFGGALKIEVLGRMWPAQAHFIVHGAEVPVDLYVRPIGPTGRHELERRFQNSGSGEPIQARKGRASLLLGLWTERGRNEAVVVAFDAYCRLGKTTRFSLFMPLSLLEEAADTGYAVHVSTSGETIRAFRPDALAKYVEAFVSDAAWGEDDPGEWVRQVAERRIGSLPPPAKDGSGDIEIRPRSGMFAAFARLNYKPWFALAELVDNAVQSYIANRDRLLLAGASDPLTVDIHVDDDELSVTDRAGGIALPDFPRAFSPAMPPNDRSGLSEFGLGMKAAACWFAKEWSVRTSPVGEKVERTIFFDVPRITREGLDRLPIEARETRDDDHFTVITMRNLRVRLRGATLAKVKEHLASIYRLLIADGTLRIRVTSAGKSQELKYEPPKLLTAPFFKTPSGRAIHWRREINIEVDGRTVTGWVGILEHGRYSHAGFSVFRRRRLIEGSIGEAYRPRAIFGAHNTFASQRIVGELHVEGFDVTHTKDGIQWGDYEEDIAYELRIQLNTEEFPLIEQANGYRAKKEAEQLPSSFGQKAIDSTAAAIESDDFKAAVRESLPTQSRGLDEDAPSALRPAEAVFHERVMTLRLNGDEPCDLRLELVRDKASEWLVCGTGVIENREVFQVRLNLDHEFSVEHINNNERAVEPILRLAAAMALAERQARREGVKNAGAVLRGTNELLRRGLSSAPIESGGDDS